MKDHRYIAEHAVSRKRLRLSASEKLAHHRFSIIPLAFAVLLLISSPEWDYILGYFVIGSIALAVIIFLLRERMLRFTEIETSLSKEGQSLYLRSIIEENFGWKILKADDQAITAITPDSFESPGELVTVVFGNGKVLLNSIHDPKDWGSRQQGISAFGWNNYNVRILKEYIEVAEPL